MSIDGIKSVEELEKAQAAAQAQGTSVTNYAEWGDILKQMEEYGIDSTGSYQGDVAKMKEIEEAVAEYIAEQQVQQVAQQNNTPENNPNEKVEEVSKTDKEQELKSTVANGTSQQLMADYMKFYHML
ncbi:hypothetical protein J6P92_02460 [bacterium]|nr:hypothetical protein [bacterium]